MNRLEEHVQRKWMLKNSIHKAFSIKGDTADYTVIEERILSGGEVKGTNLCILLLAALIASIGLNMNSTAVIIGAMLISPLMGGIMAIAYGLATSDLKQTRNSAWGLCIQIMTCLIIATLYFLLSPIKSPTSEIIARTSPTIWDVMIACFGGLAGIIGTTRKEKSNVIPGVAIATALMPPLCTAGYGIARGNLSYFLGAGYLFLINTYFICLSSVVVLLVINIPKRSNLFDKVDIKRLKWRIIRNTIIVIIPSIFLGWQMIEKEMSKGEKTVVTQEGQSVDLSRIVKNLQVISPSIEKVEVIKSVEGKKNFTKISIDKIVITSKNTLPQEKKELVEQLLRLDFLEYDIEWKFN